MTHKNVENFQTSLNLQQTYSAALGSHINNIYHKISEIQQQLLHPTQHMNTGDIIQIDASKFDPDIDGRPATKKHGEIQGSDSPTVMKRSPKMIEHIKKTFGPDIYKLYFFDIFLATFLVTSPSPHLPRQCLNMFGICWSFMHHPRESTCHGLVLEI